MSKDFDVSSGEEWEEDVRDNIEGRILDFDEEMASAYDFRKESLDFVESVFVNRFINVPALNVGRAAIDSEFMEHYLWTVFKKHLSPFCEAAIWIDSKPRQVDLTGEGIFVDVPRPFIIGLPKGYVVSLCHLVRRAMLRGTFHEWRDELDLVFELISERESRRIEPEDAEAGWF